MATTVQQLVDRVSSNLTEVTVLQSQINSAYQNMNSNTPLTQDNVYIQSKIQSLKDQATSYDTQFEEEESKLQAMGGKTRKQTLQEFVLLFFYIAFGLFIVSAGVYVYITEQKGKKAFQMVGALSFILFIITGILIRYA